ncbi:hypothetical protein AB0M28_13630 [Streptomyces sp. NPDC051940]|uniref:hypothetical protein n=1 Tax=Streptomyces sp. NPDC051940 TaxID=3155675 RepID=UPI003423851D
MARPQYVDAVLRIIAGHYVDDRDQPEGVRFVHRPSAHYQCLNCPFTASAKGRDTAGFAQTIRTDHRATCPANREDSTT